MSGPGSPFAQGPRVVALGGGHGLSATLSALRRLTDNLTAVVGVADDGGSSGRLRAELAVPPPGDLRMALASLCGDNPVGRSWRKLLQHRYGGQGPLAGHAVGNLLISAIWEQTGDVVAGLDVLCALVEARGRILPATTVPMELVADVVAIPDGASRGGAGATFADTPVEVRGQAQVAACGGRVVDLRLEPADAPACPQAVAALSAAEYVFLGPGSWYTSVLPHFELPELRVALRDAPATRVLVLNLASETEETVGFTAHTHLEVLAERYPDARVDYVLADDRSVPDPEALRAAAQRVGAEVLLERLAAPAYAPKLPRVAHNPDLLAAAFSVVMDRGRISPWR